MPSVIERLEGTPLRIKHKLDGIDASLQTIKPDGKWSILEHVGHLSDLEPLWQGRFEDIMGGEKELRAADLQNTRTNEANHNKRSAADLVNEFSALRAATIDLLKGLREEEVFRSALHPRLKTPMRMIDMFTFVAEHDDHHLAKITFIKESGK